ncbi:hypothetical protein SSP531S_19950 [Streptomyces spongiicola]|uniref:Uncharacterized protein n=1 Tax=Streptomyces spongiicola TaxID=1690221 RepID=A0A388SVC0_9ACTN|nr:hypothetical protein SSP531S_19950 [Streptomyces spongiicola]
MEPAKGPVEGPAEAPVKGSVKGPVEGRVAAPVKGPVKGPAEAPAGPVRRGGRPGSGAGPQVAGPRSRGRCSLPACWCCCSSSAIR